MTVDRIYVTGLEARMAADALRFMHAHASKIPTESHSQYKQRIAKYTQVRKNIEHRLKEVKLLNADLRALDKEKVA